MNKNLCNKTFFDTNPMFYSKFHLKNVPENRHSAFPIQKRKGQSTPFFTLILMFRKTEKQAILKVFLITFWYKWSKYI